MDNKLDPSILALTKAIGHQESGGDYNKMGDNGHSVGAYQWNNPTPLTHGQIPENYKSFAQGVGIDPSDFSPAKQDEVAYKTVQQWAKQGLNPAQIASKWNSGKPDEYKTAKPGYNAKQGVNYDVKGYVDGVGKYYEQFLGSSNTQNPSQPTQTPSQPTQTPTTEAPKSLARKVLDIAGDLTGTRKAGEDLGQTLADPAIIQSYQDALDTWSKVTSNLQEAIKHKQETGQDTQKLSLALNQHIKEIPNFDDFSSDVDKKTGAQVVGDFGTLAVSAGLGAVPGAGTVGGRLVASTAIGAAFGTTGALSEGKTSFQDIAESTAEGAGAGLAFGGLAEGAGVALKGVKSLYKNITGRTAQEISQIAEKDIASLPPKERQEWFRQKQEAITTIYKETNQNIQDTLIKEKENAKRAIEEASANFESAKNTDTAAVKDKLESHLGDANKKYSQIINEALSPIEHVEVDTEKLSSYIDSIPEKNPGDNQLIKDTLGIKTPDISNGQTPVNKTTIGELYAQTKSLKSEISKAGKSGARAFTPQEYQKSKAVDVLMSFLHDETKGTGLEESMAKANGLWKEWAPLRDRIFREIKPLDNSGVVEIPFKKTLGKIASGKASEETQAFVSKLEEIVGGPIGADTKAAFERLDARKKELLLAKSEATIKADDAARLKQVAKGTLAQAKYEAERVARKDRIIRNIALGVAVSIGAPSIALKVAGHL